MSITIDGARCAVVEINALGVEIVLSPDREYTIQHLRNDGEGATSEQAFFGQLSMPDADHTESLDKSVLLDGGAITVGPQCSLLRGKTASGNVMVNIIPGPRFHGDM